MRKDVKFSIERKVKFIENFDSFKNLKKEKKVLLVRLTILGSGRING